MTDGKELLMIGTDSLAAVAAADYGIYDFNARFQM